DCGRIRTPGGGQGYPLAMAIPDYQSCMLPLLRFLADGGEHTLRDSEESLAQHFQLAANERAQLLPSGGKVCSKTASAGRAAT
ncbi:restriction endonuclease, partial [mine drainage metagenome]